MPEVRLIDANAMRAEVESLDAESNNRIYQCAMEDMLQFFIELIDKQPTIEPEVRRGRWIVHTTWNGMFGLIHSECSECKFDRNGDLSSWKLCPNCGADMREGGADND